MSGIFEREPLSMGKQVAKSIKRFKGSSLFIDEMDDMNVKRLELSIPSLNLIFSDKYFGKNAGFPFGKVFNFWGKESAGKTAMAAYLAAEVQKSGGHILWVDAESSFDPDDMLKMYGLNAYDTETMIVSEPDCIEDATDIIDSFISTNSVDLIVVDSLVGLGTELIQNADGNANSMGAFARRTSTHMSKLTKKLKKTNISIIYINQIRTTSNGMGGFKADTTGGNAMKFFAHFALKFYRSSYVVDKSDPNFKYLGHYTKLYVNKSKITLPFREVELKFVPGHGFSRTYDIFNLAKEIGLVDIRGSWVKFLDKDGNEINKVQGVENALRHLEENGDLLEEMYSQFKQVVGDPDDNSSTDI